MYRPLLEQNSQTKSNFWTHAVPGITILLFSFILLTTLHGHTNANMQTEISISTSQDSKAITPISEFREEDPVGPSIDSCVCKSGGLDNCVLTNTIPGIAGYDKNWKSAYACEIKDQNDCVDFFKVDPKFYSIQACILKTATEIGKPTAILKKEWCYGKRKYNIDPDDEEDTALIILQSGEVSTVTESWDKCRDKCKANVNCVYWDWGKIGATAKSCRLMKDLKNIIKHVEATGSGDAAACGRKSCTELFTATSVGTYLAEIKQTKPGVAVTGHPNPLCMQTNADSTGFDQACAKASEFMHQILTTKVLDQPDPQDDEDAVVWYKGNGGGETVQKYDDIVELIKENVANAQETYKKTLGKVVNGDGTPVFDIKDKANNLMYHASSGKNGKTCSVFYYQMKEGAKAKYVIQAVGHHTDTSSASYKLDWVNTDGWQVHASKFYDQQAMGEVNLKDSAKDPLKIKNEKFLKELAEGKHKKSEVELMQDAETQTAVNTE